MFVRMFKGHGKGYVGLLIPYYRRIQARRALAFKMAARTECLDSPKHLFWREVDETFECFWTQISLQFTNDQRGSCHCLGRHSAPIYVRGLCNTRQLLPAQARRHVDSAMLTRSIRHRARAAKLQKFDDYRKNSMPPMPIT